MQLNKSTLPISSINLLLWLILNAKYEIPTYSIFKTMLKACHCCGTHGNINVCSFMFISKNTVQLSALFLKDVLAISYGILSWFKKKWGGVVNPIFVPNYSPIPPPFLERPCFSYLMHC